MTPDPQMAFDDLCIGADLAGLRLDQALVKNWPHKSRAAWQKTINAGLLLLNHETCRSPAKKVLPGDQIRVFWPAEQDYKLLPENISLEIIFEDDDILVINKPAGIAVHPGPGHAEGTLVHALLYYAPEIFAHMNMQELRPGIVHRLDKDSSGVLIIAKNNRTENALKTAFKQRQCLKLYLALCRGGFRQTKGEINSPIARHPTQRKKMSARHPGGKEAYTSYQVLEDNGKAALLKVNILTGRTHQIRVHLASIGHPIAGDRLYGADKKHALFLPQRQMLHAWSLSLTHPATGEIMRFQAEPPDDFIEAMHKLQLEYPSFEGDTPQHSAPP